MSFRGANVSHTYAVVPTTAGPTDTYPAKVTYRQTQRGTPQVTIPARYILILSRLSILTAWED